MTGVARTSVAVVLCLSLSGCYVKMHGNQSTSGGSTTMVTSSHVSGSASFSGGRVAFSSGPRVPPGAPGGHLRLSGDAAAIVVVGVLIADFLRYVRGETAPKPLPPDTRIADTCSCYQKPVNGEQ